MWADERKDLKERASSAPLIYSERAGYSDLIITAHNWGKRNIPKPEQNKKVWVLLEKRSGCGQAETTSIHYPGPPFSGKYT